MDNPTTVYELLLLFADGDPRVAHAAWVRVAERVERELYDQVITRLNQAIMRTK